MANALKSIVAAWKESITQCKKTNLLSAIGRQMNAILKAIFRLCVFPKFKDIY